MLEAGVGTENCCNNSRPDIPVNLGPDREQGLVLSFPLPRRPVSKGYWVAFGPVSTRTRVRFGTEGQLPS